VIELPAPIAVDVEPVGSCRDLAAAWRDLEQRADCSFFQSWRWIGTWLAELPQAVEPLLLRGRLGKETVALALFTPRQARRRGVIRSRQLHLNTSGLPEIDRLSIEYNGLLLDRRHAEAAERAVLSYLAERADLWEELVLDGVAPLFAERVATIGSRIVLRQRSICPYVDLGAVADPDCLDYLRPNTRHQIRRAHRLFGHPEIAVASTAAEGIAMLEDMIEQHEARWAPRGIDGAFGNDFVRAFHRRLVGDGVPKGEVQLLRVQSAPARPIGHLYNFVHRDRVYAYQSGFAQYADNRLKPGLVSHHLAIVLNRARGMQVYDFLAGDSRYKRSLSNRQAELLWVAVQRPALRFAIEQRLREAMHLIRGHMPRRRPRGRAAGSQSDGSKA
jgi:CelD/BcsL family acetyltransferase involved in cellulose biosynthesis